MLAWRSQEQAYQLKKKYSDSEIERGSGEPRFLDREEAVKLPSKKKKAKRRGRQTEGVPRGLPDRFFDEEGQVNLSRVSGDDAWKYMAAQGIKLPRFPGRPVSEK